MFERTRVRFRSWAVKSLGLDDIARRFLQVVDGGDGASTGVDTSRPYMQSVWVYAAVSLIANSVASIYGDVKGEADDIVHIPDVDALLKRPNNRQDWMQFVIETFIRLLLDGHVFWLKRGMTGTRPAEVRIVPLNRLRPDIRQNDLGDDYAFRWVVNATGEPLIPDDEIFEWKLFNPYSDVYGLSPVSPGALAIYCDVATGVYNQAFFKNGAKPGIVFSTDNPYFTQEQANEALRIYNEKYQGARQGHQAMFVGNGLQPTQVGYTFSDMEFPSLKQMSKSEVLAIFQVPDTLLGAAQQGGGVQIGGTGRKPDQEVFFLDVIIPLAIRFFGFFDRVVTQHYGPYHTEPNLGQVPVLQDRQLDRAREGREWIKAGATFNDVNQKFAMGFKPQVWGDDNWLPSNMVPARLLMNGPLAADPGRAQTDSADAKDAKKALRLVEVA